MLACSIALLLSVGVAQASQAQLPLSTLSVLEDHLRFVPEGFNIDLDAKRLVQFDEASEPVWITEREKIIAKAHSKKFFDITEQPLLPTSFARQTQTYGVYKVADRVKSVIEKLSTAGPLENLQKFTSFRTRYYRSQSGRESQLWLLSKVQEITAKTASPALRTLISVTEFEHSWGQNSIILKLKGSAKADNGTVIISAHQDSTNMFPFLSAPGADDDGSGSVTILEAYRGLLASNYTPIHNVEFHWYSAEEGGLLGSQAVATEYAGRSAAIKSQLQFDMTAWVKKGTREEVGIITDFVDIKLTDFIKSLVDKYLSIPYVETKCGYACSDHASWTKFGYPGAFSIESSFENSNKLIHSSNDRLDASPEFSFEHMLEFSKLAVAYVIEVAGWSK